MIKSDKYSLGVVFYGLDKDRQQQPHIIVSLYIDKNTVYSTDDTHTDAIYVNIKPLQYV